jgi:hypothetical protein
MQIAFIIAAFAGGRFMVGHLAGSGASTADKSDAFRHVITKKSGPPSAGEIAEAKKKLADALHAPSRLAGIHALQDYVETLDAGMVKVLIDDLNKQGLTSDNARVLDCLMYRWGELDPQAAIAWVLKSAEPNKKELCAEQIFDAFSARDPAAALSVWTQFHGQIGANFAPTITQATPFGVQRSGANSASATDFLLNKIFENYAQENPQAALAALQGLPLGQQSSALFNSVFTAWSQQNPAAAAAAASNMAPSAARDDSLAVIASNWAQQDSSAALAWAQTLPPGSIQYGAVAAVIQVVGQNDPAQAANYAMQLPNYAMQLPNGANRAELVTTILNNWLQSDPAQVLDWAGNNLTGTNYEAVALPALKEESKTNPAAAAAFVMQNNDANITNQAISSIAQNWTQQNPQAALSWAVSLPVDNTTTRDTAIQSVLSAWITNNPSATAAYLMQNFATDPSFTTLATSTARAWASSDPQSALTWVNSLPPGEAQNSATLAAIQSFSMGDPQDAWNTASQLPDALRAQAQLSVVSFWAPKDPVQAAQVLSNIPPGSELDTATSKVAGSWLTSDPNSASQWISTLPQGSAKDAAINQIITIVGKNDPGSVYNWAITISDPIARNDQVVSLATQWSSQNPSAAATAAQNALLNLTGLTQEQQNALRAIVGKSTGQ